MDGFERFSAKVLAEGVKKQLDAQTCLRMDDLFEKFRTLMEYQTGRLGERVQKMESELKILQDSTLYKEMVSAHNRIWLEVSKMQIMKNTLEEQQSSIADLKEFFTDFVKEADVEIDKQGVELQNLRIGMDKIWETIEILDKNSIPYPTPGRGDDPFPPDYDPHHGSQWVETAKITLTEDNRILSDAELTKVYCALRTQMEARGLNMSDE